MRVLLAGLMLLGLLTGLPAQEPIEGLVAQFAATEGAGTVLHDRVGGVQGRVLGAQWVTHGNAVALDFDGLSNYVDCGDPVGLRLADGPLSYALWVRPNTRGQQYLLTRYGWSLYLDNAGVPNLEARSQANDAWQGLGGKAPVPLGEWSHLMATYDPTAGEWRLYVNGELSNSGPRTGGFGGIMRSKLALGSWAWTQAHFLNGLLSDIRIYNRALSAAQVQALYEAGKAKLDPELKSPLRRFSFRLHGFPVAGKLDIAVSFRNLGEPLPGAVASLTVIPPAPGKPLAPQLVKLDDAGRGTVTCDVSRTPAGLHRVRATIAAAGQTVAGITGEAEWTKPGQRPWWMSSKDGVTAAVPAPWTALKTTVGQGRATVACWNRQYRFDASPFPAAIKAGPADLLAGPVRLRWQTAAGAGSWQSGGAKLTKQSPAQVVLRATGQAAGVGVSGQATVEYDGMVRVDWTMTPQAAGELRELVCEVPLRGEFAKYYYYYPDRSGSWEAHQPGSLPAAGVTMPFNPCVWLGDETRGLQWFTEHDANWLPGDPQQAVTVRREGDQVILRLHVIGQPVALDPAGKATSPGGADAVRQLRYTFGFQATPVKPKTRDAWDLRSSTLFTPVYSQAEPGPDGKSGLDRMAGYGVKSVSLMDWTDVLCHNQATDPAKLRNFVKECHRRGIAVLVYFGFQVSDAAPEFAAWGEEALNWFAATPYSYESGLDNYPPKECQTVYRVCYQSYWTDFIVAGTAKLMDEYGIDGVYLDGTGCPLPCYNHFHGCGPVDGAGEAHPRTTFFGTRDLMRRLYVTVMQRNPRGQINLHNSAFMTAPSMGFATSIWDGEQLSTTPGRPIQERMPLDYFRTEFMGHQWGFADEFLEYVLPYPFQQEWGLTLLHDVPTRPYMYDDHFQLASGLWRLMDQFGRQQATWLPYWSNQAQVRTAPAEVYTSLYRHPRNGVLAVVLNYRREPAEVTVALQPSLGLPAAAQAKDGLTGEPVPLTDGKLSLKLDSLGWKTIWVK